MTRVLVCGGRDFCNVALFEREMQMIHETHNITLLIHGAARGADRLASKWAQARDIEQIACPANWSDHGKAAGPIRNQYMLDVHKPDLVIAFSGGRGTADMIRRAMATGAAVYEVTTTQEKTND